MRQNRLTAGVATGLTLALALSACAGDGEGEQTDDPPMDGQTDQQNGGGAESEDSHSQDS